MSSLKFSLNPGMSLLTNFSMFEKQVKLVEQGEGGCNIPKSARKLDKLLNYPIDGKGTNVTIDLIKENIVNFFLFGYIYHGFSLNVYRDFDDDPGNHKVANIDAIYKDENAFDNYQFSSYYVADALKLAMYDDAPVIGMQGSMLITNYYMMKNFNLYCIPINAVVSLQQLKARTTYLLKTKGEFYKTGINFFSIMENKLLSFEAMCKKFVNDTLLNRYYTDNEAEYNIRDEEWDNSIRNCINYVENEIMIAKYGNFELVDYNEWESDHSNDDVES